MIKKTLIISIALLSLPVATFSQRRIFEYLKSHQVTSEMEPLRHLDVAVTGSTSGIGFDVATPLAEWAQLRMGATFRPYKTYQATFSLQMGEKLGVKVSEERFQELSNLMYSFTNTLSDRSVVMYGDAKMNNFKLLVDLFPIRKHRNFHVTVGFFWGNDRLINANVSQEYQKTLAAVNIFNAMYKKALGKEALIDINSLTSDVGVTVDGSVVFASTIERLRRWGRINHDIVNTVDDGHGNVIYYDKDGGIVKTVNRYADFVDDEYVTNTRYSLNGISIGMGNYGKDIIAAEDIYYDYSVMLDNPYYVADASEPNGYREERYVRDANGNEIKKGSIKHHKGDVVHKAGEEIRLMPDEYSQLTTIGKANSFKPYIGVGYTLPITKDKRTCISVDAGVMIWGGYPSVNIQQAMGVNASGKPVYYNIDLTNDVTGMPSLVTEYVNKVKNFPVFPEVGIRLSHRLW